MRVRFAALARVGQVGAATGVGAALLPGAAFLLMTAGLLVASPGAWAQGTSGAGEPLENLKKLSLEQLFALEVTSVSQKPEFLSRTAAAVHVVTPDDLRQMGVVSIPEALRNIPGVEVARVDARQYAISARGFNGTVANKLLVMIDGRSVYTPLYSGVFWDVQDAFIEDIEQIEVIRGPGATVWGANAVNGVINVRSKHAADTQGLLLHAGGGHAERGLAGARWGGALGARAHFRVYGKWLERAAALRPNGLEAGDELRMGQGGARVDWTPSSRNEFTLQGDAYDGSAHQPTTEAIDLNGGNVIAQWRRRWSETADLELRAYYDHTDRVVPLTFGEVLDTYDVTMRHRFALPGRQDLVWGLGYRLTQDDVQNSPGLAFLPAKQTLQLFSGFLQNEFSLAENRVRLTIGSKVEHNEYTGFEYQPSARVAWTPQPSQTLWGAASRAVRTPSRIDREFYVPATPPYLLAGSPDFESEVLRAFELGYKVQPVRAVTASMAAFYNLYDRLRSLELGIPSILANGYRARTHGVELEAACQVSSAWRVNAGQTFLGVDLDREAWSTDATSVRQSGDSPRYQSFVRSSLVLPRGITLDAAARYVGNLPNQQVPAYATADGRVSWQAAGGLELELLGQNLLAPQHPEFGSPTSRREVRRSLEGRVRWLW